MKRYRTREEKVCRLAVAIAVILVLLSVTNAVNFLPRQALKDTAEMQNISQPQVICSFYNDQLKVYRVARQYFVEGEDALMLCAVGWEPLLGWYDRDWCVVGTCDDAPVYIGFRSHQQGEAYTSYVFGRVDDAAVAKVVLRWRPGTGIEDDFRFWELPQEAFFRGNGQRYLLWETDEVGLNREDGSGHRFIDDLTALAYDESGTLLYENDVRWHSWGTSE